MSLFDVCVPIAWQDGQFCLVPLFSHGADVLTSSFFSVPLVSFIFPSLFLLGLVFSWQGVLPSQGTGRCPCAQDRQLDSAFSLCSPNTHLYFFSSSGCPTFACQATSDMLRVSGDVCWFPDHGCCTFQLRPSVRAVYAQCVPRHTKILNAHFIYFLVALSCMSQFWCPRSVFHDYKRSSTWSKLQMYLLN